MREEVFVNDTGFRPPPATMRRVSWGAIFAGLFVTIVIQLTLTVLGTAIGASLIRPLQRQYPGQGLAIGSVVWLVVSGLISLFVGAYVAGRLSGGPRRADGLLHGIVTWSVAETIMVLSFMTATGALLGGFGSVAGNVIHLATAKQSVEQQPTRDSLNQSDQQLQQTPGPNAQADDVEQISASGISKSAWCGFVALILGLLVSAWGGWAGTASLPRYQAPAAPAA